MLIYYIGSCGEGNADQITGGIRKMFIFRLPLELEGPIINSLPAPVSDQNWSRQARSSFDGLDR